MILIVGSTGALGTAVARGLLASRQKVRALVRDAATDKARQLEAAGAALVVGDLKSPATLDAAVQGIDTIVCTASATLSRQEGDAIETVDQRGIQNLIDAAEHAHTRRFIFVSFSRNIAADFPLAAGKRAAERRLEASPIDYTILLPSYFAETWLSPAVGFDVGNGRVRIYGPGTAKVSYVSLEDVARAVVACVGNPRTSRQAIPIGGPEPLSQLEAVALAERAGGRKLQLEFMSSEQIAAARAATQDSLMASFLGLFAALAKGDAIASGWTEVLGVEPRSIADWITSSFG